jgi:hypothetical protein
MEEIYTKMEVRNEMKLYMEVADKPIDGKVCIIVISHL